MTSKTPTTRPDPAAPDTRISRRLFGQLMGLPAVLASTATVTAMTACGGDDDTPAPAVPGATTLTRGEFVATISSYFDWIHSSEYNDPYKLVQPGFVDVIVGATPNAKAIETAAEEAVVDTRDDYFHPDRAVTREEAAEMYAKAFRLPVSTTDALAGFTDAATISADRRARVNALVAAGHMKGRGATEFAPAATLSPTEAAEILQSLKTKQVAPPQVMCKSGTTAPRRYVRISTPTEGAQLFYTFTFDGTEPADPSGAAGIAYDFENNGVLQFVNPLTSTTDYRLYKLKAVAKKDGMTASTVQSFTWNIVRPRVGAFQSKLIHAGTDTSPTVWKINNPAEYYQAFVFYIEGSTRGLVFDAGEYAYDKANLKTYIDTLATKPYDIIVGHNHPDHAEQIYNFTSAGVTLYASEIEKAAITAASRADFKTAGAAAAIAEDGHVFDLGNVQVTAFMQPGHTNGLMTAIVNQTGWVFGSDMFCCNRAYTADTTQYAGVKVDLFLSLVQQLIANYQRVSTSGLITELTNAHQEVPVGMEGVKNFVQCFQQLIDQGDAVTRPSIRGGRLGNPTAPTTRNSRMSIVGDMWRDKNWMAVGNSLGTGLDRPVDYFSAPTTAYASGVAIDYNAADGFKKYAVLSNIQFTGGTLVGVDVYWAAPANGVPNKIANKFDPWTVAYTVHVPSGRTSLVVTPTAMSSKATSVKVNGTLVARGASTTVAVAEGTVIDVEVVSPDGSTTARYTFTVAVV